MRHIDPIDSASTARRVNSLRHPGGVGRVHAQQDRKRAIAHPLHRSPMKAVAFAALLALCAAASNAAQPCAQMRTRQLGTQWRGQDQVPSCARLWSTGRAAVLLPADSTFVIHGVIDLGIQGASSAGPTSRSLAGQAAARVELGELGLDDESESGNDDNKMVLFMLSNRIRAGA